MVQAGTTSACYDADFDPFGGEHIITNTCPQNYKFTGKERDTETGLDDFEARYYSSQFGRFHSADWSAIPAPVPYADLGNPQTLNLYAYVKNNPLNLTDPTGHMARGSVSSSEGMYIVASRTFNPLSTEPSFSTWGGGNDVTWEVTVNGEGAGIYFDDKDAADAFVASARPAQSPQARPSLARISLDPIREEIVSQAKAYGVPASLAAAVIQKESNFDPNAVNKASGDYGLMQVNKSSFGKKLADEHGFAFTVDGARVKSDWRYNIHVGMSILKNAYQSALLHGGDVPRITYAQYNSYKHWTDYAIPGRRIFKNVEAFMQIYDQYPH